MRSPNAIYEMAIRQQIGVLNTYSFYGASTLLYKWHRQRATHTARLVHPGSPTGRMDPRVGDYKAFQCFHNQQNSVAKAMLYVRKTVPFLWVFIGEWMPTFEYHLRR